MSTLSPVILLTSVVRPALVSMGHPYHSTAAEQLLMGTAAQESGGFLYLRQKGPGPALGIFQMEPDTFYYLWEQRVPAKLRPTLVIACGGDFSPTPDHMAWHHRFGAMMARLKYRDDPNGLPAVGDVAGLAWSWKRGYNSIKGKGTTEEFTSAWNRYIAPYEKEMWS